MSHAKLIDKSVTSPHKLPGSNMSHNQNRDIGGSNQPSALQQKHLQHIVGSGRNSLHGVEDASNARQNPFAGSNLQGPLA